MIGVHRRDAERMGIVLGYEIDDLAESSWDTHVPCHFMISDMHA